MFYQISAAQGAAGTLEALYVAVGLQRGEDDVQQPQAEEEARGQYLGQPGATKLASDLGPPAVNEDSDADEGEDGEECD